MLTTLRASLAVALLVGFYLFAVAIVVGLVWGGIALMDVSGRGGVKLMLIALVVAFGMAAAFWKVLRTKPEMPNGVVVTREQAPELWSAVTEIAGKVGTRAPDEIQLVAEVNAAVVEDAKWLGLVGGRRYMLVGTPLLQTFTVDQLRSVLAHELGHYSHNHTRLGALTYRGRLSIAHTVNRLDGFVAMLMAGYGRVYYAVESAVSRRQEFEADLASVRVAGKHTAASALRELPVLSHAWAFYLRSYIGWGLDSGYAPQGIVANFPQLWHARTAEFDKVRQQPAKEERSIWDSHPPIAQRIAAIAQQPEVSVMVDGRPADVLIPGLATMFDRVERHEFNFGSHQLVSFADFTQHAYAANQQYLADQLYRAAGRLTGEQQPGLLTVLNVVRIRRQQELAQHADYEVMVKAAVGVAITKAGAASWVLSWSGPAELTRPDGTTLSIPDTAAPLLAGDVDKFVAALTALGVELSEVRAVNTAATADRSEVIGAMVNMKVDGKRMDLLVLDTGLIVLPGSARLKMGSAKRRLAELAGLAPTALIAMDGHRYFPYEDMRTVTGKRVIRKSYVATMTNGSTVRIGPGFETEDLGNTGAFARVMKAMQNR